MDVMLQPNFNYEMASTQYDMQSNIHHDHDNTHSNLNLSNSYFKNINELSNNTLLNENINFITKATFIQAYKSLTEKYCFISFIIRYSSCNVNFLHLNRLPLTLSPGDLQYFLESEQNVNNIDLQDCVKLIKIFEPLEELKEQNLLGLDGFIRIFKRADLTSLFNPMHGINQKNIFNNLDNFISQLDPIQKLNFLQNLQTQNLNANLQNVKQNSGNNNQNNPESIVDNFSPSNTPENNKTNILSTESNNHHQIKSSTESSINSSNVSVNQDQSLDQNNNDNHHQNNLASMTANRANYVLKKDFFRYNLEMDTDMDEILKYCIDNHGKVNLRINLENSEVHSH